MPISSVSRVFVAPDPVMETDLELLGKVNTYQQAKFDAGASALQQEVNNWAAMTQIAKPELRQYANAKLVNLVNGINNLGGVNLSDINNVNSLKAQGYNIYGDQVIMDGIGTTMKMKALQNDARTKLSGKDGGKYDSAVSNYLMKGYNEWATDGDINNTRYDGPTELPQGNMNMINEKVQKYLKALTPDSDAAPQGELAKSYGYFQFEGKWLKGDRIREAIDAVTDENDSLVFRAHGWSALRGDTDQILQTKIGLTYDATANAIKENINQLNTQLNNTSDAATKMQIQNLIGQQTQALSTNAKEKASITSQRALTQGQREGIQESLYRSAWRNNVQNSFGFQQRKTEYKANMPLIFHDRMEIQAQQWAKDYDLRVKEYELRKNKAEFEMGKDGVNSFTYNPNLPFTQQTLTGTNNQMESPVKMIDQFNTEYFQANYAYYRQLYNLVGAHDTKGRFENKNGEWIPKPAYVGQIDKEVGDMVAKMDNYANLSTAERDELNKLLPTDPTELQGLFQFKGRLTSLKAFSKIAQDKETDIINSAIAHGKVGFDWRNLMVRVTDGNTVKDMPVQDAISLGAVDTPGGRRGVFSDEAKISAVPGVKYPEGFDIAGRAGLSELVDVGFGYIPRDASDSDIYTMKTLRKYVNGKRDDAEKIYIKEGGAVFNNFSVPLPIAGLTKFQKEVVQKQLTGFVETDDAESINPLEGQVQYNFSSNKPSYQVKVEYKKGGKQQAPVWVDITQTVTDNLNNNSFGIHSAFPKSDLSHVWGLTLSKDGSTPFSQKDNYKDAIRTTLDNYPFQVSTVKNMVNGSQGTRVKVALPIGGGKTIEVNVKNFETGTMLFPPDVEMVQRYLDVVLGTPEKKAMFYKLHGLEQPK